MTMPTTATSTTGTTTSDAVATVNRRAVRLFRREVARRLLVAGAWFWVIWAGFVFFVPWAIDRWGGEMVGLTYELAGAPARWVALAVGAIIAGTRLRLHVAAGGTRRSVVDGAALAAASIGPLFGAAAVVLTLAEERWYGSLDIAWPGGATPLPLDSATGIVVAVVGETFVVVTYLLVGVAATGAFRTRLAVLGPVLVAGLLVPCVLVDLATRTGIFAIPWRGGYDDVALGAVGTVLGGLVAVMLAAVLAYQLLTRAPIHR
jgi:hypothetical protein